MTACGMAISHETGEAGVANLAGGTGHLLVLDEHDNEDDDLTLA